MELLSALCYSYVADILVNYDTTCKGGCDHWELQGRRHRLTCTESGAPWAPTINNYLALYMYIMLIIVYLILINPFLNMEPTSPSIFTDIYIYIYIC